MRNFKIINDNNISVLRKMKEKSVDMIFVDPPYNMQLSQKLIRYDGSLYDGIDEDWDKFSSIQSYKEFSKKWLKESLRVLKDDGTMWIIGSFQNIYLLGNLIQEMDLWLINDIIWEKAILHLTF